MTPWPVRSMIMCAIPAFFLAGSLASTLKSPSPASEDLVVQTLGGTAGILADKAYIEADVYFHKGAAHDDDAPKTQAPVRTDLPLSGWIKGIQFLAAPRVESHIQGTDEKELLPWFIVATRLNPKHIDAWCTGTYWFYRTGDKARAEEFATEGIRENPTSFRIRLERGILYHRLRRWNDATRDLEAALRLAQRDSSSYPSDIRQINAFLRDSIMRASGARRSSVVPPLH